jgi:hypothetical protein
MTNVFEVKPRKKNVQFKDFYDAIEAFFEWCGEKGIDDMDEVRKTIGDGGDKIQEPAGR